MKFGENLCMYRKEHGLSRESMATSLDISSNTYRLYESKGVEPRYDKLLKLSQILDVSIDTLMDNATNEHKHNRHLIAYLAGKLAEIASVTADKPVTPADIIELAERNVHK